MIKWCKNLVDEHYSTGRKDNLQLIIRWLTTAEEQQLVQILLYKAFNHYVIKNITLKPPCLIFRLF